MASKEDKVNKIVDEYMDLDGDGNLTMVTEFAADIC